MEIITLYQNQVHIQLNSKMKQIGKVFFNAYLLLQKEKSQKLFDI